MTFVFGCDYVHCEVYANPIHTHFLSVSGLSKESSTTKRLEMKKEFTEEQIIGFLREAEAGVQVKELCRRHGFSEASY